MEFSRVDNRSTDARSMAPEILRKRVHHDIGPVLEGPAQVRRRHGIVDDQWHAMPMREFGDRREVGDITLWIPE